MNRTVIYIHGKGGSAEEAGHYRALFPDDTVLGFDYRAQTPWEAAEEFSSFVRGCREGEEPFVLIANSIGAFFSMHALSGAEVERAYFISPIVNMEKLITDMMDWAGVTEQQLLEQGTIETAFGETLSMEYLTWVRNHPVRWKVPTSILYGSGDTLQSMETVRSFAETIGADLTVMEHGEHWFHTEEQMQFLNQWLEQVKKDKILLTSFHPM